MGLLRSNKSYAMEIATKPLVMASEIAGLDSHRAFHQAGEPGHAGTLSAGEEAKETARVHRAKDGNARAPEASGSAFAAPGTRVTAVFFTEEGSAGGVAACRSARREAGRVYVG